MGISFNEVSHLYRGIKKKDINIALENISLNINEKNEFIAIVGKTGSGKSTLIQHMNALKLPSKGNVEIFDYVITPKQRKNPKLKNVRRRVGFVFQFPEYQLFEETVLKDIMFAPLNFGMKKEEAKAKAIEIAKLLKIEKLLDKSPFNLSGGQMRKAAIAGILSYDPDILLLDEPTRGLDPRGQEEIMKLFYNIHKKTGKTIVMITHDMNIVYEFATRVIVLNEGKITYDGSKEELFSSDIYKNNSLSKPEVLDLIDYLNDKLNLNIGYDTYTLNELLKKLEKNTEVEYE
ncbi:MAG: energy-coupling factor transporter ATPase [Acholeplasmatales bacterium]|nr:energy-coupling factor transporter ATPase [Acholeplasmatales bacterium]